MYVDPSEPARYWVGGLSEKVQAAATLFMNNVKLAGSVLFTQICSMLQMHSFRGKKIIYYFVYSRNTCSGRTNRMCLDHMCMYV